MQKKRKEKAVSDLMEAKADIQRPVQKKAPDAQPFFEKEMSVDAFTDTRITSF